MLVLCLQSLQVPDIDTIDLISFVEYAKLLQRAKLERVVINDMIKGLEQLFEVLNILINIQLHALFTQTCFIVDGVSF